MRHQLEELRTILEKNDEEYFASLIEAALCGPVETLDAFLVSNELWGGAGSIADEAGVNGNRETRELIRVALEKLGEEQIRVGIVNTRTVEWVHAFRTWRLEGI